MNKTKGLTFICIIACLALLTLPFVRAEDTAAPVVNDISHSEELAGATCNFGMTATDETELDSYIFYFDNGVGDFTADPAVAFTPLQTEETVNVTKTLNTDDGVTIKWKWYANDTLGNEDTTEEFTFATTPTPAQAAGNSALANYWIALTLVALIPLIMGVVIILTVMKTGEGGMGAIIAGIGSFITFAVIMVVGITMINGIAAAMP